MGPDGPVPLVLLHAFPLDASMWGPVARLLTCPTIALDLPGFGSSPDSRELAKAHGRCVAPSITNAAREVLDALSERGVDRAVIAGLSLGGYVAMAIAEEAPERLAGIGLLDTKAEADDHDARMNRRRIAEVAAGRTGVAAVAPMIDTLVGATTHADRPDVVEEVRGRLAAAPPSGIVHAQRAMADRPGRLAALDALGARGVAALVLRGDEDVISSAESAETMARALRTEVVTVPGAGHLSALETPQAVADALEDLHRRATA